MSLRYLFVIFSLSSLSTSKRRLEVDNEADFFSLGPSSEGRKFVCYQILVFHIPTDTTRQSLLKLTFHSFELHSDISFFSTECARNFSNHHKRNRKPRSRRKRWEKRRLYDIMTTTPRGHDTKQKYYFVISVSFRFCFYVVRHLIKQTIRPQGWTCVQCM